MFLQSFKKKIQSSSSSEKTSILCIVDWNKSWCVKTFIINTCLWNSHFFWHCCTQNYSRAIKKWVQWIFGIWQLNTLLVKETSLVLSHFLYFCINETQKSSAVCHAFSLNDSNMDFRSHKSIYIYIYLGIQFTYDFILPLSQIQSQNLI